jgi:hypothetical protein
MMTRIAYACAFGSIAVVICVVAPSSAFSQEWEESTPYYEDDAWYDISEWLDGNDYNPTDEKFGRWDDEFYDSDSLEYDDDDDLLYGYTDADDSDNWFYDYWEPDYRYIEGDGDTYDYAYTYYDYDGDGLYDSYTSHYDWDENGWFEDVDHYTFDSWTDETTAGTQKNTTKKHAKTAAKSERLSSKRQQISGQIQNKKNVAVRGIDHVVVQVKQQDGQPIVVDLGPKTGLKKLKVETGSTIAAQGPMTKAADKQVLLANSVTVDGQTHQLDRQPREFQGTIVDTREVNVRGQPHTLVVMKTQAGKQRLVDIGRSDRLEELDLRKNAQITVRGVPFKVKNRPLVMAHSVESDGTTVFVYRRPDRRS